MTTLAQGSTVTVTLAVGESVSVATNGGRWWTTTTPLVGPVVGPSSHFTQTHRTFGPLTGGGTVAITNQTSDTLVYIQTGAGVVSAPVSIASGTSSTVTLGDQGSVAVANPGGYWIAAITPLIGAATTLNLGPNASRHVFGPYAAGATVTLSNLTGGPLVAVPTNSSGAALSALRAVSASNYTASASAVTNVNVATTSAGIWRIPFVVSADTPSLVVSTALGWFMAPGAGITLVGNGCTITQLAIEMNGVAVQCFFGGSASKVIANGDNDIQADEVLASAFGLGTNIPSSTTGYIRVGIQFATPASDKFANAGYRGTNGQGYMYDVAKVNVTNGVVATGAIAYSMINGGTNGVDAKPASSSAGPPMILLGRHTNKVFGIWGDSKAKGTGDTAATPYGPAGLSRALLASPASAVNTIPGISFACPSGIAADCTTVVGGATLSLLTSWYKYVTHGLVGYGTNAQTTSAQTALHAQIRAGGIVKIVQVSLTPRTADTAPLTALTSSGTTATATMADTSSLVSGQSYPIAGATVQTAYNGTYAITVINSTQFTYTFAGSGDVAASGSPTINDQWRVPNYQVPDTKWATGQAADTFQIFCKNIAASDPNYTYVEIMGTRAATSGANYWKWLGDGNALTNTADGLHETSVGYELSYGTLGNVTTQSGTVANGGSVRSVVAALT